MDKNSIEKKWQKKWDDLKLGVYDENKPGKKYYMLEMFSYPSAANLHLGHWYNFGLSDSFARFKMMTGYNVFQPMGFDSFGLPAENYAIKYNVHPKDNTNKSIATMEEQLRAMGAMFDWTKTLRTSEPEYFKWTQWLFLQLYKHGLAYQKDAAVNWCPGCMTVIANEQVIDGGCERCSSVVEKKSMKQWFFKITAYAQELIDTIDALDWPEKSKIMQKNWIGRSEGGEIEFLVADSGLSFRVYTTRADTLFGVSYAVLAPENPLVDKITTKEQSEAVADYRRAVMLTPEIDRLSTVKEKTGVFTGAYALNPINNEKIPVFIADYVLYTYGTGAVMGVPAHDTRDYEFAKKYSLPIKRVIENKDTDDTLPFVGDGYMVSSLGYNGLYGDEARRAVLSGLQAKNLGEQRVNYRLRDWSVSRQRYWGAPIPIIYCDKCGTVPVEDKDLPVDLPYDVNFTPNGQSPLRSHEGYMNVKCPKCGANAKRDPDTLDTFVCSSWYYLRYPDANNDKTAFDPAIVNKMLPVDKYVGGAEHVCMHLLYARFVTKALRDMGHINFSEPFKSLIHQGMILGADGTKMSKSRGNTVNPDTYIKELGSDVLRTYLAFGFNYTEGGPWSEDGLKAINRFYERIERISQKYIIASENAPVKEADEKELGYVLHNTIKSMRADIENFSFNTAIARSMELLNAIYKYDALDANNPQSARNAIITLIKLLAPFAPHLCDEMHNKMTGEASVFLEPYPDFDPKKLLRDEVEIVVQINSKIKCKIIVPAGIDSKTLEAHALNDAQVIAALNGAAVKKVIAIPGRLINVIV